MNKRFIGLILLGIMLVLAGCKANIQDQVICPLVGQEGTCRIKGEADPGTNEKVYTAISLNNQVGIFTNPFSQTNERAYEVVTGFGIKPYPVDYTVLVQKGTLDFKTESNVADCGNFGNRCSSLLEDVTLEYSVGGTKYTRLIAVNLNGTVADLNVTRETIGMWTPIIQSDFQLDGTSLFFNKFWFWYRNQARSISIGEFDPIADQWGIQSKTRIGAAMMDAFNTQFPYRSIGTISVLSIRHLDPDNNAVGGIAGENQNNPSIQATNDAFEIHRGEILATQVGPFCKDIQEPIALALCRQAAVEGLNGQDTGGSQVVPVVLPTSVPPS